ncbi:hypothetical protein BKK80_34845 (plasmid) [Cupriavidus malaysiensis]|uniref:Uncharacterized protein n=1 Tax=Cupriavidus malaysiensis TaxID=367825 RepID=A0ABM6FGR8_9BURK|nr:hypothetical protein BKK80_34845 [Cupriavidus malaysiensis]
MLIGVTNGATYDAIWFVTLAQWFSHSSLVILVLIHASLECHSMQCGEHCDHCQGRAGPECLLTTVARNW